MTYYRVKPEYDQVRKFPRTDDYDFLVADELFTERERDEMPRVPDVAFEIVDIPEHCTYTLFGARFESHIMIGGAVR